MPQVPDTRQTRGLALASGGARGAYQAGALVSLAQAGYRYTHVAGTSIGTLNGAYYAQCEGDPDELQGLPELWRSLKKVDLLKPNLAQLALLLPALALPQTRVWARLLAASQTLSLLDPGPVADLLDRHIDYGRVKRSGVSLHITALSSIGSLLDVVTGAWRTPDYFCAHEMEEQEIRQALLAATAIPFAFAGVPLRGAKYADAALADPIPAQKLYELGIRRITALFLSDHTPLLRDTMPEATLLSLHPSERIDTGLHSMFSFEKAAEWMDLGQRDAETVLANIGDWLRPVETTIHQAVNAHAKIQSLKDRLSGRPPASPTLPS